MEGLQGEHPVTFSQALAWPPLTTYVPKLLHFQSSALQPLPGLPPSLPPSEPLLWMPVTSLEATTGTGNAGALGLRCLGRSLPLPAQGAAMRGPRCHSKHPQRMQDGGPRQMGFGCSSVPSSTLGDAEPRGGAVSAATTSHLSSVSGAGREGESLFRTPNAGRGLGAVRKQYLDPS